ncbi:uncharacterized protein LOC126837900 [Adelges cooleyi]|uniref:uncharacterized protein LOC126837900 n=1 Tax=Adelges cooleyi TaxID=133065 RepID=UPI00217F7E46|nr:uncharacterized protein LOC126837900 [Adelges cooleyi]
MHRAADCKSKLSCSKCQKRHHTLLHSNPSSTETPDTSEPKVQEFCGLSQANHTVVLGTAVIRARDSRGNYQAIRILLDSGSQVSAITTRCASRLGLTRRKCLRSIRGLGKNPVTEVNGETSCYLLPRQQLEPSFCCNDVIILQQITTTMPTSPLPSAVRECYKHLLLADPKFDTPAPIDMLIGGDLFPHVMRPRGGIIHHNGLPSAINTHFGWIVCGSLQEQSTSPVHSLSVASVKLDDLMRSFWAIEEAATPIESITEEQRCEEWFSKTTTRANDGRFCVALPFRDSVCLPNSVNQPFDTVPPYHGLGNSRAVALKRFYNLEMRLIKDPALYAEYRAFMAEYAALGHMRPATQSGYYYIPHHAVVKRDGENIDKLRVVFDASAATSTGFSLNDVLLAGPKLQNDIFDILQKCRLKRYMLTADITKMYRQVLVRDSDCRYQYILWRDSVESEIVEYELCTVTYGVTSAPYLAIKCLNELDAQNGSDFPAAKGVLTKSTYVDDIVAGADTVEELLIIQSDLIGLLKTCGCSLKKWTSNSPQALRQVDCADHSTLLFLDPKNDSAVKVLGMHWDPTSDMFAYHTNIKSDRPFTKRKVLSTIARLFDPIGTLGPILLWANAFMQRLWQASLEWDNNLPEDLDKLWGQFVKELPSIDKIMLPRHIDMRVYSKIELVGFSDASLRGYAAVVYLRVVDSSGHATVNFVTCKTKVAPIKTTKCQTTVPRLELCAALLLATTLNRVKTCLDIDISNIYAWTDSTVVLSWLTVSQKSFKVFVTNRIAKIQQLLPDCKWSYINTTDNPADPASRGLLPHEMVLCDIHREGPTFLRLPAEQWPRHKCDLLKPEQLPDYQQRAVILINADNETAADQIIHRFSSLTRMQRTLAYVYRFRFKPIPTGPLSFSELHYILNQAVRLTQQRYFNDLKRQLISRFVVTPASLAQLSPFIDSDGLIRVGGRLRYASLDADAKHPVLLPKTSHLSELLIKHYHQGYLHAGPKLVLSMMRRKFWILSGRDAVRHFIYTCVPCIPTC